MAAVRPSEVGAMQCHSEDGNYVTYSLFSLSTFIKSVLIYVVIRMCVYGPVKRQVDITSSRSAPILFLDGSH